MELAGTAILIGVVGGGIVLSLLWGDSIAAPSSEDKFRKIVEDLATLDNSDIGRALMNCSPDVVLSLLRERAKKALADA